VTVVAGLYHRLTKLYYVAFNWQTFKTRTLTAAVFVVVMLVGLLWNQWSFFVLFSIIHFGCWWEYLKLIEKIHNNKINLILKLGFMLIGYILMILFCDESYQIGSLQMKARFSLPMFAAAFTFLILVLGMLQKGRLWNNPSAVSAFGLVYISLSCGFMIDLYHAMISCKTSRYCVVEFWQYFPLAIIFTLWINDTMAYIIGSLIGKTQMTTISPKKTWEGTIGGVVISTIIIGLLLSSITKKYYPNASVEKYHWYLIPLIAAVVGTIGDIFESKLKRMAGVKDSGRIMPGHGGFLDRFDSLLFAAPFVWLYVNFFM
jgi:phosphatidate cytidylyltransferase